MQLTLQKIFITHTLRFAKPVAKFRTQFAYEDIFPMLAGKIISQTAHQKYGDFLYQQLLAPLGMNRTYVDGEAKLYESKNVSQRFEYFSGRIYSYPEHSAFSAKLLTLEDGSNASGGIKSSANDMAKWLIFNINNGESEKFYAKGWFVDTQEYKPYTVLYHSGGGRGMHALMAYIPQKKIGIVILTNTWGNKVPDALYQRFFDLYLNKKPLKNWSEVYLQAWKKFEVKEKNALSKPEQCQVMKTADLKKYAGIYYNPVYGDLEMTKQGDHLSLKIGPASVTWKLTPCKNNIFQAHWPNAYGMSLPMFFPSQGLITFTMKENGEIDKMTIPYLNGDGNGIFEKK